MSSKTSRFVLAALLALTSVVVFLQTNIAPAHATTVVWSSSTGVPAGSWSSVAYGNGRWTAVASGGTNRLMTSSDGITWTTSDLTYNGSAGGPVDGTWFSVLYANSMWVAAGLDGRLMTSSDGLAWTTTGVSGLTTNEDIMAVAYKPGLWVAVGMNSGILTSADGLSWSSAGVSGAPAGIVLRSVVWSTSRGKFVAVGDSTTVIYSSDGLTWSTTGVTGITASQSLTSIATGVASNGNIRFVITAPSNTGGQVWSSTDGLSWTGGSANTNCTSSQRWNVTAFGNGRWMTVRGAGGACDSISSILGIQTSWEQPTGGTVAWWNSVAYGNGRWVAVGSNIAMSSPEPSLTPTFGTPVATSDGFTVNVTNYSASYFWASAPTVTAGTATWGTASGSTRPLTVTGLSGGSSATVTVTATRSGFAPGSASVSGTSIVPPQTLTPNTQTVSGTGGTAITPSSTLTGSGYTGAITYSVTSGSLPAGLQLDSSTGVVSGTPSATSSATITITGTSGIETATATITFVIVAPATTTTTTTLPGVTTTTVAPATTTTAPSLSAANNSTTSSTTSTTTPSLRPTPVVAPSQGQEPTLVTASDATLAGRQPGQAAAIVNGQAVVASVEKINTPAISISPTNRTAEQVNAVQQAAASLVAEFSASLPQNASAPVSITNTSTGAVINGLLVNPRNHSDAVAVPVENVVMMTVGSVRLLLVGATATGKPLSLADGSLQVGPGGILSIAMAGLPANTPGEAVLFSTPTLLGSFTTTADGAFAGQFTVPSGMEDGSHSLIVKVGTSTVSLGVHLDDTLAMPQAGIDINSLLILVMLLLVAGISTKLVGRRISEL